MDCDVLDVGNAPLSDSFLSTHTAKYSHVYVTMRTCFCVVPAYMILSRAGAALLRAMKVPDFELVPTAASFNE